MVAVDNAVSAIPFTSSEIFLTSLTEVSALVEASLASVASCLASPQTLLLVCATLSASSDFF
ncbi:hypothetical protein [Bartonella sp. AC331YNZD]|uniref:hypothetical protein n=1 Tax=Bartonella sp. AC331YNZD TaxID=3243454 RepID=UPI0035CF8EE9